MAKVKNGIDRFLENIPSSLKKRRVGLLAHPASVTKTGEHILTAFRHKKINLTTLFGPEHGLWGTAQDMIGLDSGLDRQTGLKVVSLYGNTIDTLKPRLSDLDNVDVVICDLQDIGTRYYTFIYTMAFMIEACARTGKEVIVLDRPNPINGTTMEGAVLETGYESFVGAYPLPVRHGMTIGELAHYFNDTQKFGANLTVIKMTGWKRSFYFDDTDLLWVLPSPNMPTLTTAILYPGQCLFEATQISEGRGTTKPFEWIGAPFINPFELSEKMNRQKLGGVLFRPVYFHPQFQKCAGLDCGGVFIHLTDRKKIHSLDVGVKLLETIAALYPNDFQWRDKPYEFVSNIPAIDLLWGNTLLKDNISLGKKTNVKMLEKKSIADFAKRRKKHLLY